MINAAKIDVKINNDPDVERILCEFDGACDPYSNILSAISMLNSHRGEFNSVVQITSSSSRSNFREANRLRDLFRSLSRREAEVYDLALRGMSNREIAGKLFISVETVRSHRRSILRKAGMENFEQLKSLLLITNHLVD